jgi:hypothetical protein
MNTTEKKDYRKEQRQFEFTLYLNDNIIVQRFFNVIGFNNRAIKSMNFKEAIDTNQEIIRHHLKNKTLDYMNENSRAYYENPSYDQNNANDVMKLIVKMGDKVISHREWSAKQYPVKVRYTVDVREHIYDMITRIQKCLSEKNDSLETTYLNHNLAN